MTARPLTQRQVALRQQLDAYAALGYLTWQPINRTIVSITPTGGTFDYRPAPGYLEPITDDDTTD